MTNSSNSVSLAQFAANRADAVNFAPRCRPTNSVGSTSRGQNTKRTQFPTPNPAMPDPPAPFTKRTRFPIPDPTELRLPSPPAPLQAFKRAVPNEPNSIFGHFSPMPSPRVDQTAGPTRAVYQTNPIPPEKKQNAELTQSSAMRFELTAEGRWPMAALFS
jgi:hypothetical protein